MPRYLKFLPIALIALAVQILAPIAACWAAAIVVSDPLQSASVCHDGGSPAQGDQTDHHASHGACAICCVTHTSTLADAPNATAFVTFDSQPERFIWPEAEINLSPARGGSGTARAPPQAM
ncbi:DUF2946 family protein [Bradyrhizobium sp. Gha]|uniref:DUF2946 family protein n=1 Tax=Bradyrhizobium sp. Gha TaxID=1855318 RepID=UPI0008F2CB57|nr:DUF2946 family protein [Bradyrhizobium sp. Gha]SFH96417.1 Protein of unknown function [Bradyrhizobium sp. Gha]